VLKPRGVQLHVIYYLAHLQQQRESGRNLSNALLLAVSCKALQFELSGHDVLQP
jgi:hypothetical protein